MNLRISVPSNPTRPPTRARRCGFTLIELVASAVLSALMMAVLLSIVWSTVRETSQLRRREASNWPLTQLVSQMQRDFANSRGLAISGSGVQLYGFLGTDPRNGESLLTPALVSYEVRRVGDRGMLLRTAVAAQGTDRQPVWFGAGALIVEPLEELAPEDALLAEREAGGLPATPGRLRVTLRDDQGRTLWSEVIQHHGS